jgi:lipopolysaccharide/colanic/teichoic acid biosynthesis glycosyltransferase
MIKRCVDLPVALLVTLLLLPVIVATAIAVRYRLGSPILFKQVRPGRAMKPFTMLKFRTMTNDLDHTKGGCCLMKSDSRLLASCCEGLASMSCRNYSM